VRHTNRAATNSRTLRNFRGGVYVAALMAELDRAAISQRLAQAREEAGLTQPEACDGMLMFSPLPQIVVLGSPICCRPFHCS
jgi:hypothetical protein